MNYLEASPPCNPWASNVWYSSEAGARNLDFGKAAEALKPDALRTLFENLLNALQLLALSKS
jgi:hypothetical protein